MQRTRKAKCEKVTNLNVEDEATRLAADEGQVGRTHLGGLLGTFLAEDAVLWLSYNDLHSENIKTNEHQFLARTSPVHNVTITRHESTAKNSGVDG